mgnify:CR=1 FL=1
MLIRAVHAALCWSHPDSRLARSAAASAAAPGWSGLPTGCTGSLGSHFLLRRASDESSSSRNDAVGADSNLAGEPSPST